MKTSQEEILNQAIGKLKKGLRKEDIISLYPAETEQLKPLLEIAEGLLKIPKKSIPEPVMQRKFMLEPVKNKLGFAWLKFYKIAGASMSVMLIVSAIATTAYGAFRSLPGEALFSVKKSAEQLQLKLATSPEAQANLHVVIAQKRLDDAKQVINNPESNTAQQSAAITELLKETTKSIDVINTVTKSDSQPSKNQPIVNSIENITNQQQALITEIKKDDPAIAAVAEKVNDANVTKVAEIKKYIEIASNEQSLTELSSKNASTTSASTLGLGKNSTSSTSSIASTTTVSTKTNENASSTKKSSKEIEDPIVSDPNQVIGSFIMEDPKPQSPFAK